MLEFVRLYRSLSIRQILGVELAWVASLGFIFGLTTWMTERQLLPPPPEANVAYSTHISWDLSTTAKAAITLLVALPFLIWVVVRDPSQREGGK